MNVTPLLIVRLFSILISHRQSKAGADPLDGFRPSGAQVARQLRSAGFDVRLQAILEESPMLLVSADDEAAEMWRQIGRAADLLPPLEGIR